MTLNGVIANRRVISPNSVAFGTDTIWKYLCMYLDQANAVYGDIVKSSRSLSHLCDEFLVTFDTYQIQQFNRTSFR